MQMNAFVILFFFEYLSPKYPPKMPEARPKQVSTTALAEAYYALNAGKFLRKKTGKK